MPGLSNVEPSEEAGSSRCGTEGESPRGDCWEDSEESEGIEGREEVKDEDEDEEEEESGPEKDVCEMSGRSGRGRFEVEELIVAKF